jgi:uncharacterized membrane protein YuzA (DUF378 family)
MRQNISKQYKAVLIISCIIAGLGAFNWLLSVYNINLVSSIFSKPSEPIIYGIIGLSGVLTLIGAVQWSGKKMIYDSETGKKLEYFRHTADTNNKSGCNACK